MDIQKAIEWMEGVRSYFDNTFPPVDRETADYVVAALKELGQYRQIGTPDECREARGKQVPEKPDRITAVGRGLRENDEGHMIYVNVQMDYYECPKCGSFLVYASDCENDENYQCSHCTDCGQAIDWSGVCGEAKNSLHEGDAGQV